MSIYGLMGGATVCSHQLPTSIGPKHYSLFLYDIVHCDPWTYQGRVEIHLDISSETKRIVFNAQELKVWTAELVSISKLTTAKRWVLTPSEISYDHKYQRCMLDFEDTLPLSSDYTSVLHLSFQGTVNDKLTGFYRSSYREQDQDQDVDEDEDEDEDPDPMGLGKFMLSTQFQPTYARRAFPCFDEPNLKATFDFSIEIDNEMVALSNMAKKGEGPGRKQGSKVVEFERTPIMCTYLLAWAVGEFEYIEQVARTPGSGGAGYPVRLYTTKGLTQHGKFGLQMAIKALDLLSKMFRIEYPLSKLDLLAVHGMADDAMENWGLLTFQTTALLFDEIESDTEYLTHIAYIVAHELAHQWFGNLVTMEWWNELWLNEGFATWAGWHVVDVCYPEWNVWAEFVGESMQEAFHLDSLRASHPVEVPVLDALAVESLFDAISYSKGSSLIRMLAMYMGVDVFLQGVSDYLNKFAYGNTTAEDLWKALSATSGLDVSSVMRPWIMEVGFPVVKIKEGHDPQQLVLQQKRYLWDDFATGDEDQTVWWIPTALKPEQRGSHGGTTTKAQALEGREVAYINVGSEFRFLNGHQAGFYRTELSPSLLQMMELRLPSLSAQEQIGLLGDVAASAASSQGSMTTATLLSFMLHFRWQLDFNVWKALISQLDTIKSIFSCDARLASCLDRFILALTSNAMERIGYSLTAPTTASSTTAMSRSPSQLRGILISAAGLAGHEAVASQVFSQLRPYLAGDERVTDPCLRQAVLQVAVNRGGVEMLELMKEEYKRTRFIDGKEAILGALGQLQSPELAREYLSFAFDGNVETEELACVVDGLADNDRVKVREALWHFVKEHWSRIEERYQGCLGTLEPVLRRSLETLVSNQMRDDVELFFKNKDTTEYGQGLAVALESIAWRANYMKRDRELLREWLQASGFGGEGFAS